MRPSEMSTKRQDKKKNKDCPRGYTKEEVKKSEKIFSELSNNYDIALEKLALKRSSNNEVFECVKKTFNGVLQNSGFKKQNDRYNFIRAILSNCGRILKLQ